MLSSHCALLTVDCELLFSPNSNHSRTYAKLSRKSNYSRTYAKQGVGVCYLHGNVSKICRRADISIFAREKEIACSGQNMLAAPLKVL